MSHMQNTEVYSYMNVLQCVICVMYSNWVASWHGKREDHVIKSEP